MQFVHFLQRKHSLTSFELLGHTAPAQAGSLLLVGPFLDYVLTSESVFAYHYSLVPMVSYSLRIQESDYEGYITSLMCIN